MSDYLVQEDHVSKIKLDATPSGFIILTSDVVPPAGGGAPYRPILRVRRR